MTSVYCDLDRSSGNGAVKDRCFGVVSGVVVSLRFRFRRPSPTPTCGSGSACTAHRSPSAIAILAGAGVHRQAAAEGGYEAARRRGVAHPRCTGARFLQLVQRCRMPHAAHIPSAWSAAEPACTPMLPPCTQVNQATNYQDLLEAHPWLNQVRLCRTETVRLLATARPTQPSVRRRPHRCNPSTASTARHQTAPPGQAGGEARHAVWAARQERPGGPQPHLCGSGGLHPRTHEQGGAARRRKGGWGGGWGGPRIERGCVVEKQRGRGRAAGGGARVFSS